MIVFYGKYRFGLRKIGVRNDFCNSCENEKPAELWRSFDCGHIFWIPLLPLGNQERWLCSGCRQDPLARYETKKPVKIIGLFVLVLFFAATFSDGVPAEDMGMIWGMRGFFVLAFLGLLYSVLKKKPEVTEDQRRAAVVPLSADTCPYCHSPLAREPHVHCPACQIRIYT